MRSLRALTWLLVLLVLVPAGVLAWLGFRGAEAWDAAVEGQIRRELDDAEAEAGRVGALVLEEADRGLDENAAWLAARVRDELPLAPPREVFGRLTGRSFRVAGEDDAADPLAVRVLDLALLDERGRRLDRAEYVPTDGPVAGGDVDALLDALRRESDRLRYGRGDPEGALALWAGARERMPGDLLRATCDVEAALVRIGSGEDASVVAEELEDAWDRDLLWRVGRPAARLWIEAALSDSVCWSGVFQDPRVDGVPLTREERQTIEAAISKDVMGETEEQIRRGREGLDVEAEVAEGAILRVRYDADALRARIRGRIRDLGTWGPVMPRDVLSDADAVEAPRRSLTGRTVLLAGSDGLVTGIRLEHREAGERMRARDVRRTATVLGVLGLLALTVIGLLLVRRAVRLERDAIRLRDDFIANVSHELRTPLTSVCLHAEMLTEEEDPPADRRRELARVVRAEGGRLAALVDDLLDFAALERGVRRLEPEPIDLAAAVRDATAPYETLAEREGVDLTVQVPEGELVALADAHSLSRILANLLSNAWRHGRPSSDGAPGRIRVRACGDRPTVEVCDDGPGIAADERTVVFERFRRGRGSRRVEGTGLGLALGRDLARAMDGDLELVDDADGTVFRLTLPPVPDLEA